MQIERYTLKDLPEDLISRLNAYSLFTSTGFTALWETLGGRAVFDTVKENGEVKAVLPGIEFGRGFYRRYQALPDGLYCRILYNTDDDAVVKKIVRTLFSALVKRGYMKLHISDYYRLFESHPSFQMLACRTALADISAADWQPPDKKIRSEIHKAEREGIVIEKFEAEKHFDKFVPLMRQTEKRHGRRPKYTPSFFEALARLVREDARIWWVYVNAGDEAVASHIYLVDNDMALNWQIYFNKKFSSLKSNQYILYSVARQLAARGVRYLNFGATPGDAAGLEKYKNKWGGKTYRYPCYRYLSWLGRLW